ncbi:MAG: thioredoxin domain-containing protein [Vicinamibacterales bacterium]
MNRLARERSPYLLQHAGNPVDWYPWGEDAFARARSEGKPIFLSIGYSTCHWCHVMEHESFESADVAAFLNAHFVSIKVDREERPDVDRVYMAYVQGTTGSGGWPMSVWLTPELKPFYGGTYFPPSSRWGRPGFIEILREIDRVWQMDRDKVRQSADAVTEQLRGTAENAPSSAVPGAEALEKTVSQFRAAFDGRHAGFGGAPKFPRPSELLFLLREHARTGDDDAREMAVRTLTAMALGGMRDHIGGGFHRYSVDAAWRVPHFEKMLYDQAQLVLAYLEAGALEGDRFLLAVAEDTLRYVQREMTDAAGGFYSAEDADSIPPELASHAGAHRAEGAFYLWRSDELDGLLGAAAPIVATHFGIEPEGNAPADPQQEFVGKNLLYVARSIVDVAAAFERDPEEIVRVLDGARLRMFEARLQRPRPRLDDKVLTAWNGLMIAAFARAARTLRSVGGDAGSAASYLTSAERAARFIRNTMWDPATGTVLRRFRDGHAEIDGYAEDYACLIFGLLELFQADPRREWLEWAIALQRRQDALFWDDAAGGWFSTTGRDASVLLRMKEDYDGAEPTASSVSVMNLLVLSHLHGDETWASRIERTLRLFGPRLEQIGRAVPMMASALSTYTAGVRQIVIVGEGSGAEALAREASSRYRPFSVVLPLAPEAQRDLAPAMPWIDAMHPVDGHPAAYVCRDFTCRPPVTTADALTSELAEDRS